MPVDTVGTLIREHRKRRGMTLHELANASGLNYSTIVRYESDQRDPVASRLVAISDALGLRLDEMTVLFLATRRRS